MRTGIIVATSTTALGVWDLRLSDNAKLYCLIIVTNTVKTTQLLLAQCSLIGNVINTTGEKQMLFAPVLQDLYARYIALNEVNDEDYM